MEMEKILQELDRLFVTYQIDKVEGFLRNRIDEALMTGDEDSAIMLLNELIGHLRDIGKYDACNRYCDELLELLHKNYLQGTIPYATSLLNIANCFRACGRLEESMVNYRSVQMIYEAQLDEQDIHFAGLYNNLSLLYQEMGDFESACSCLRKALHIVERYNDKRIETAVTHTNLAASLLKLGLFDEAMDHLKKAFSIFEMDEKKDFHYSGALAAMGEAKYMAGDLEESAAYYKKALDEIEKNTGKSKSYEIIAQNLNLVEQELERRPSVKKHFDKGLDLCEAFYHEFGEPMLYQKFPQYMPYIATGLVGEGSECLGFDDEVSRDHDFGPGFCIWMTDSLYEEIGEQMQKEYDKLPTSYQGVTRLVTPKASKRVGVFTISEFYERLTGNKDVPQTQNQWLFVEDYQLASATSGKVFYDGLGVFSRIRKELLQHYPEEVRVKKIAREAALIAQSGQYNYGRMFGRGDKVTAHLALANFERHTMQIVYLLNRKYAPFYKWMHKGMEYLPILKSVSGLLEQLAELQIGDKRIPQIIEMIVTSIISEMKKQSLTTGNDTYLDHHTDNILKSITQKDDQEQPPKKQLVDELVRLEWKAFDQVQNEGGRAECQNNWPVFSVMRESQYLTWTIPMLQSYIQDFREAEERGWNLITEKYGRMMESTDPIGFARIRDQLPSINEEKKAIIEQIVQIQIGFMEACAKRYPKAVAHARNIHTTEDSLFETSYETYLRGEISTYSDKTLDLYGRFIAELAREGSNLAEMILTNTARFYGYESLEDLERKL